MSLHKVVWQEGMLLRPQHFQQSDRYYDHQLKARTQKLGNYAWGFFNLEIDRQFLNMGKLVLNQASGILPDGTLFELGSEREPLALDIPPNTGSTPVYLALPLVTGNHIETRRPEQKDVLARYTAHELDVADSNAGDSSSSQVSTGLPDFRLLLGEQQSDQAYVKLQLCEVLDTTPDGVISLDPEFIPTYVNFQASGYLLSCLKEVISMLAHRGDTPRRAHQRHRQGGWRRGRRLHDAAADQPSRAGAAPLPGRGAGTPGADLPRPAWPAWRVGDLLQREQAPAPGWPLPAQ